jgi:HD domain
MSQLSLPETPTTRAALEFAGSIEPPFLLNHSVRSYLFARLIAHEEQLSAGGDYDEDHLFLTCVLHDIGLTDEGDGEQRFEVQGADLARGFLVEHGLDESAAREIWQAIALHTSGGIAERMAPLIALTRAGIGVDFGARAEIVPDPFAEEIHRAWPRLDMATCLVDEIVARATARPSKAVAYSLTEGVISERATPTGMSRIERQAHGGRWGC